MIITSGCASSGPNFEELTDKSETSSFKTTYLVTDKLVSDPAADEPDTSVDKMKVTSWVKDGELVKQSYHPAETGTSSVNKETEFVFYYPHQDRNPESYLLCGGRNKENCRTKTNYPPRLLMLNPVDLPLVRSSIKSEKLNSKGVKEFAGKSCQLYTWKGLQKTQKLLEGIGFGYGNRLGHVENIDLEACLREDTGAVLFSNVTVRDENSESEIVMETTSYAEEYSGKEINPPEAIE